MSETYSLQAQTRTSQGRHQAGDMRAAGQIPGVVYGHGVETRSITVNALEFNKLFTAAGESSLIELSIDGGAPVNVVVHEVQRDPVKYTVVHADFYQVRMDEKIHAEVPLVFTGVAPAEKNLGGTLLKTMDHLEIICLPKDLLHDITIDVSVLATFDDTIRVKDLAIPAGVEVTADPEDAIASVTPPRTDAELEALNEAVVEDVESVGDAVEKKSKEEEAPAEDADKK